MAHLFSYHETIKSAFAYYCDQYRFVLLLRQNHDKLFVDFNEHNRYFVCQSVCQASENTIDQKERLYIITKS